MKDDKVKQIIADKVKKIGTLCFEVGGRFDEEVIHDFRVGVKKLRSFLRLLKYNDNTDPRLPRKFMELYRVAGGIRQAQLELAKIDEAQASLPLYTAKLKGQKKTLEKEWTDIFSDKAVHKLSKRFVHNGYSSLRPAALSGFLSDRLSRVKELLEDPQLSDAHLHDIRKRIKDLLYMLKFAKKDWPAACEQVGDISMESLDHLANMIGDYNDASMLMVRLSAFADETKDLSEKANIQTILAENSDRLAREKAIIADAVREQLLSVAKSA